MNRGRPRHTMTTRRRQVLDRITEAAQSGERLSTSRVAREIGVYSFRDVKRIIGDLQKMQAI